MGGYSLALESMGLSGGHCQYVNAKAVGVITCKKWHELQVRFRVFSITLTFESLNDIRRGFTCFYSLQFRHPALVSLRYTRSVQGLKDIFRFSRPWLPCLHIHAQHEFRRHRG